MAIIKTWTDPEIEELVEYVNDPKRTDRVKDRIQEYATMTGATWHQASNTYYRNLNKSKKSKQPTINMSASNVINKGVRHHKTWTGDEERDLKRYIKEGKTPVQIANFMNRTEWAIKSKVGKIIRGGSKGTTEVKTSRIPLNQYLQEHNLTVSSEAPKAEDAVPVTSLIMGSEIRVAIKSLRIENGELVISL